MVRALVPMALLVGSGCIAEGEEPSETSQAATVSSDVTGTCSSAVVLGLSKQIVEGGAYGPQTEARLRKAPATGFAKGAGCIAAAEYQADVVQVDGPDRVQPETQAHYRVTIQNNSDVDWPATTELRLATATETASQLHDDSWRSPTVIATLGNPVPAGTMGEISFDVTTPAAAEETPIFEELVIQREAELDAAGKKVDVGTKPALWAPGAPIKFDTSIGPRPW